VAVGYSNGKLLFIFVVGVAFSALGAWIIAARYRAAVRVLMSRVASGVEPGVAALAPVVAAMPGPAAAASATLAENRHAGTRLTLALVALSALVATSGAALQLSDAVGYAGWSLKRLAVLAAVQLWPVLPALAIVWRWSRLRLFVAFVAFLLASYLLLWWRSDPVEPAQLLRYIGLEVGLPMLLIAPLCLGASTRAIAPWLLPPMLIVAWSSIVGIDVLAYFVARRAAWLGSLGAAVGSDAVVVLFAVAPWLVAWWPLRALGRLLARAYASRSVSELSVQFSAVWAVQMIFVALGAAGDRGIGAIVMLLPLLCLPLGFAALARWRSPVRPPATLLVLRVFQHDAAVLDLFDRVVERWRLTGNTLLIAGTDLIDRTLDAGDVLTFLDRRLDERFVSSPADVEVRVAEFDLQPDLEGRFRINECYCHDSTWRAAFAALAARSDVVLMDLRGFQARNEGCRHELASLAAGGRVGRVVLLVDAATDRASAEAAVEGASAKRFAWVDAGPRGRFDADRLLARLFAAPLPG
jgi:hypothetical protein